MSCGVGHRHGSDLELLWLWYRPVATALIRPLAWEPPCAAGAALEKTKRQNNNNNNKKNTNTWRLNNMLLNNQWIMEEIKEEIKKYLESSDKKDTESKISGMQQK